MEDVRELDADVFEENIEVKELPELGPEETGSEDDIDVKVPIELVWDT